MPVGQSCARNEVFEGDAGTGEHMWKEHLPILILPISLGQNKKSLEKNKIKG